MPRNLSGACCFLLLSWAISFWSLADADIFEWEYLDASRPELGKQESTVITFGGAGVVPGQGADLSGLDLWRAWLPGADLRGADLSGAFLFEAVLNGTRFDQATLDGASFYHAELQAVGMQDASIRLADFGGTTAFGFNEAQLRSTLSYSRGDLKGIGLDINDLSGWSFAAQDLRNAGFSSSVAEGADFRGADLREARFRFARLANGRFDEARIEGASFVGTTRYGFTQSQLASTSSFQDHSLSRVDFGSNNLNGWSFRGQDLTAASFQSSDVHGVIWDGASITEANFSEAVGRGFRAVDMYLTHSYQEGSLRGINLRRNDLSGWDFKGIEMVGANLSEGSLVSSSFEQAVLDGASLVRSDASGADFRGASLEGADLFLTEFEGADLRGASFRGADLERARFLNANLGDAIILGADLTDVTRGGRFTEEQLASTASYRARDLREVIFDENDLDGWDFSGQDLRGASFAESSLFGASFRDAIIAGVNLRGARQEGFTRLALYDTDSYALHDLRGINLGHNTLDRWSFADQDLRGASFGSAFFNSVDFQGANLANSFMFGARGSVIMAHADLRGASSPVAQHGQNVIRVDGLIEGFRLLSGESMRLWDYEPLNGEEEILITIQEFFEMADESVLRLVFEDRNWGSMVKFESSGVAVSLGGTLLLDMSDRLSGVDLADLDGVEYQIFDWTNADITGLFDQIVYDSSKGWFDVSKLMTTGTVTFYAVPEPGATVLFSSLGVLLRRRAST
ncbi:MAG: pentapeptide repeat-containing protein [Phycisphaeraceae bacterium]